MELAVVPPSTERGQLEHRVFPLEDLSLGIDTSTSSVNAPPGSSQEGTNNLIWLNGFLRPRAGLTDKHAVSDASTGEVVSMPIYREYSSPASAYIDKLARIRKNGSSYTLETEVSINPQVWSTVSSGSLLSSPRGYPHITWTNFKGKLYIAGFDKLLEFSPGGGLVSVASQQAVTVLQPQQSPGIVAAGDARLFIADCYDQFSGQQVPGRVCWSDFNNARIWNGGEGGASSGSLDLPRLNRSVTGLAVGSSGLMIFTERETYLGSFVGSPKTYALGGYINNVGCVSHETIRAYRNGSYVWLGDDNVYIGAPGQMPQAIGDQIRLRIRKAVNLAELARSTAHIDIANNLYHLFLPAVGNSNLTKVFTFNFKKPGWWEGELTLPVKCSSELRLGPWEYDHLLGGTAGKCYTSSYSYSRDLTTNFEARFKTSVMSSKNLFQGRAELASYDWARVHASRPDNLTDSLSYVFWGSNGLDSWESKASLQTQDLDGSDDKIAVSQRLQKENFYLELYNTDARQFPFISRIEFGATPMGNVRR